MSKVYVLNTQLDSNKYFIIHQLEDMYLYELTDSEYTKFDREGLIENDLQAAVAFMYHYVSSVYKARYKPCEWLMSKCPVFAVAYAVNWMGERFLDAEETISTDEINWLVYSEHFEID